MNVNDLIRTWGAAPWATRRVAPTNHARMNVLTSMSRLVLSAANLFVEHTCGVLVLLTQRDLPQLTHLAEQIVEGRRILRAVVGGDGFVAGANRIGVAVRHLSAIACR